MRQAGRRYRVSLGLWPPPASWSLGVDKLHRRLPRAIVVRNRRNPGAWAPADKFFPLRADINNEGFPFRHLLIILAFLLPYIERHRLT